MKRTSLGILGGILVSLLLIVGAIVLLIWLKLSSLKEKLVHDLGRSLNAKVQVTSLDLDIWKSELHASGITLINELPSAPWEKADINQVAVHFHMRDLMAGTMPVQLDISTWNVVLNSAQGSNASSSMTSPSVSADGNPVSDSSEGQGVQVTQISAQDGTLTVRTADTNSMVVHGVSFQAQNDGSATWNTELQATSIADGSLLANASSVQIKGEADKLSFFNLRMTCAQGTITGEGEQGLSGTHPARFDLKATNLPVEMLLATQWQLKLMGLASGEVHYQGDDQSATAHGKVALTQGKFNLLASLDKVPVLMTVIDLTNLDVDTATTDFDWKDHTFHFTNVDLRKNGYARLAGTVDVSPTGQLDGKLKLGLPSTMINAWPQLQEKIFTVQLEDYNWTDVHLTGTADHLQEDLTPRLTDLGLQQGSGLLNQATQKASDLIKNLLGK